MQMTLGDLMMQKASNALNLACAVPEEYQKDLDDLAEDYIAEAAILGDEEACRMLRQRNEPCQYEFPFVYTPQVQYTLADLIPY